MSALDLLHDLLDDAARTLNDTRRQLLDEVHHERLRVIKLEGHRLTLLSHLECSANLLLDIYPTIGKRMHQVADEIRKDYETAKPKIAEQSCREAAPDPKPDNGSAVSEAGLPVGSQDGVSESAPYACTCAYTDRDGRNWFGNQPCKIHDAF